VLSTIVLEVSVDTTVTLSFFTTVVESVVVVDDPDPQAAKALIANTDNNFFMLMSLDLIPVLGKGNPTGSFNYQTWNISLDPVRYISWYPFIASSIFFMVSGCSFIFSQLRS